MATLPEGALMQQAAAGLAHAVLDLLGGGYGRRVLLLVGAGNNGGDALYAGAMLARRGCAVEAWLLADAVHEGGLAALRAAGGRVGRAARATPTAGPGPTSSSTGSSASAAAPGCDPTRRRRSPGSTASRSSPSTSRAGSTVDTGELDGAHVAAALTVTFGTLKVGHLVDPAAAACGSVHLVDLGLDLPAPPVEALQPADVRRLLPQPPATRHKYTRGVVGVRAGSATYPGAALLCVGGADCGLAGMVRYVGEVADVVRRVHPEVVGEGRVQAWAVGSGGGDAAGEELAAARRRRRPGRRRRRRPAARHGPARRPGRADPPRGRAGRDDRRRPRRRRGPRPPPRPRRGGALRRGRPAQGPPHAGRPPRRPGPRHHHRRALAGHRRCGRRPRGAHRRPARRRPGAVRRRERRLLAARRRRDPRVGRRAAAGRRRGRGAPRDGATGPRRPGMEESGA